MPIGMIKMTEELESKIIKILQEKGIEINLFLNEISNPKETEEYIIFGYDGQIQITKDKKDIRDESPSNQEKLKRINIREISNEELKQLAQKIRPVAYYGNNLCYLDLDLESNLDIKRLRSSSFIWELEKIKGDIAIDLKEFTLIIMKFTFGSPILFKPTVTEVLSQIPEKLLEKTVAYEIPEQFLGSENIINLLIDGKWETFHLAVVRLYKKEKN